MKKAMIRLKKQMPKCLSGLLALCIVLTGVYFVAPIEAEAAVGNTFTAENGISYKILTEEEDNYTVEISGVDVTKFKTYHDETLPSIVEYNQTEYSVVGVGDQAFANKLQINVHLPNSIRYIGDRAFHNHTGYVTLPEGIETIGDYAFATSGSKFGTGENWNTLVIPSSVTSIGDYAFVDHAYLCSVTTSAKNIGAHAFDSCNALKTITLTDGVEIVGEYAFAYGNQSDYRYITLAESITTIGDYAFYRNYTTNAQDIELPKALKKIGRFAFAQNNADAYAPIVDFIFNEGLLEIGEGAFSGSKITEISLPNSLITIGNNAFANTDLTSVIIPKNVETIGTQAFYQCDDMTTITVYSENVVLGDGAFDVYALGVDMGVRYVYAIAGSTTDKYMEAKTGLITMTYIAELTWNLGGGTASVELPSGYYEVGDEITITNAMWAGITRTGYTMGTVTCNGSPVMYVNPKTGRYMSTTHTMAEDGLSFVVNWTANEYTVTFDQNGGTGGSPASATFTYGSPYSLTGPVAPTKDNCVFEGYYFTITSGKQTLTTKIFNADMTPARTRWEIAGDVTLTAKWTLNKVEVGDDFIVDDLIYTVLTKEEGNYTVSVSGNTLPYVSDLVIPETVEYDSDIYTVTEIANGDFSWNSQTASHIKTGVFSNGDFNSVTLPDTITKIGDYAFYNAKISEIVLSESLEVIGLGAFDNVYLTHIELPNGLLEIGNGAFMDSDLVEITIPESVTKIYNNAFQGCKDLVKVKFLNPDTVIYGNIFILSNNEEMVIYGFADSTAQAFCENYDYAFSVFLELTWDLGGGTSSAMLPSGYYAVGDEITVTAAMWQSITRTGYKMGTVTCNGNAVMYVNPKTGKYLSTTHAVTEDGLSFVVNWTANTYTATFDQNGGTGGSPETATFTYGSPYSLTNPVAPTKEGYRFEGYYVTLQSGRQKLEVQIFNADMTAARARWEISGDVTLKAKWTPIVTGIAIPAASQNQTYYLGADFVPFNITATYGDGTTAEIAVTEEMLTNFSTDTMGTRTATVTYEGKTATFEYTVSGYAYTVEHYLQKITFDGYEATPRHTETLYGVGTTNAAARSYEGFTAKTVEQVNIAEDGTSVVKVYYDKNAPTLTTNKYDLDDDGNYDEVYELASEWDLKWFASQVNAESPDLNAVLMNNISLTTEHIPIGVRTITGYKTYKTYVFTGMFDGQGYCVENLYIKVTTEANRQNGKSLTNGLFGITDNAIIKNVTVVAPVIDVNVGAWAASYPSSGGVVGYAENTSIENCYVKSGINTLHSSTEIIAIIYTTSQDSLRMYFVSCGGLVGYSNNSIIRNCSVDEGTGSFKIDPTMDASGRLGRDENAGGLVGYALSTVIENCYVSDVDLLNYSWDYQGGLAGYFSSSGRITNCYSYNESVGTISSSCITQNVYSSYETNAFADCDEEYGTNLHSQWYRVEGEFNVATLTIREGQTAPYGQTTLLNALNYGTMELDGALAWEYGENGVTFVEPTVSSISIPAEYQNQTYVIGNDFKPFNIVVSYEQGGQRTIEVTADMVTGLLTDALTTTAKTATVTYGGKTATFEYVVAEAKMLGDVNGDGFITNADVLSIYRYIYNAELYPLDKTVADVNKDGNVTNADVLAIYRYIYNPELYPIG